ncbi:MAG: A24 family peptidase [Roseburia sp.]|nr:A24 family peptidase [Roseburia sp.]MCM1099229.1 A24 family peptidase [Ruminococcus flavefaciens]
MALLCVFLAAACVFDHRRRKIPNALVAVMAATGILIRCRGSGIGGAAVFLAGSLPVMVCLYPFFKIGALGAGDVKLFGVTAGFLPLSKIWIFSFVSLLIAAIFSLVKLVRTRCFRERFRVLFAYLKEVGASGSASLYPLSGEEREKFTVPLAGAVTLSVLLFLGGAY